MDCPTWSNVPLAFWPSTEIAARQTTMMSESITAYSTAVGPSSRFRKSTQAVRKRFIELLPKQGRFCPKSQPGAACLHPCCAAFEVHDSKVDHAGGKIELQSVHFLSADRKL